MPKQLVVLAGPDEGRVFQLGADALMLGRSRATESHLLDPHVSRIHCQVSHEGEQWVLADFDSAGGTFVNGKRVAKHVLVPGDIIRIGATRLQFTEDGAGVPPVGLLPPQTKDRQRKPEAGVKSTKAAGGRKVGAAAKAAELPTALPVATPITPVPDALPVAQPVSPVRGPAWMTKLIGETIGHFKIGSPLARSKSGFVFHARDTRKNQAVAVKVLDPDFSTNDKAVKRFVAAMKQVLPLRHSNLIKFLGAGKTAGHCWIAAEYFEGESLAAVIGRIENTGMLDWRQVLRVGVYLARALDYAHSKNLIHQSVCPQNILLGKKHMLTKLTDLMLASAIEGDPTTPISAAGVPSEELSYMPPERTDGPGKPVDARADIYSLGATIYAMLSGQPPFQASTVQDLVFQIRLESPPRLKSMHLGVPENFEQIIIRCLAKRPEDRFQTIKEVLKKLEAIAKTQNLPV